MTEPSDNAALYAPSGQSWPLNGIVRAQLAIACVWGPYAFGVLVMLTVTAVEFIIADESGVATTAWQRAIGSDLMYWCGVVLGALAVPIGVPRVWPAAVRIHRLRRTAAAILGPAAVGAVAFVVKRIELHAKPEFSLLVEPLVVVLGTALGAGVVWAVLREAAE